MDAVTRAKHTVEYMHECFDLDADAGQIVWKVRPLHHFRSEHGWRTTNGRSAGRVAGSRVCSEKGYRQVEIDGVSYKVHRIIFALANGKWPDGEIDHINGDPTDNSVRNMRDVSGTDNMLNKGIYRRNETGEPNISLRRETYLEKRWHVQMVSRGVKHQAYFATLDEARIWRDAMRVSLGFHLNHGKRPGYSRRKVAVDDIKHVEE